MRTRALSRTEGTADGSTVNQVRTLISAALFSVLSWGLEKIKPKWQRPSKRAITCFVNALEDFRTLGIDFVSLHEGVDTSTPNGRLVSGIFTSIAEFEKRLIRDRVRSGLALAKSQAKKLGRPRVCVDRMQIASLRR